MQPFYTSTPYILQALTTEAPSILALAGCVLVGVIFWRRAPLSSLFVLLAGALSLVPLLLLPVAWQVAHNMTGTGRETFRGINMAFSTLWSLMRAVSTMLLLAAVYLGRQKGVA